MAKQQGNQYEKNVAKFLQGKGLVDKSFTPAGSMSDRADLEMKWMSPSKKKEIPINVELKIEAASGGSLVLKWNKGKWGFEDKSAMKDNPEKIFLAELAEEAGALKILNKKWNGIPTKGANPNSSNITEKRIAMAWKDAKDRKAKDRIYSKEQETFYEENNALPGRVIADYYAQKDTYYINIGTNGFYTLGKMDPAGINENCRANGIERLPVFSDLAKIKWRARVQPKGGGNFQYTFELSFTLTKSADSPYNIGPCQGGGNVSILARKANIDCFL